MPGVYYFSDQNFEEAAEYIGTVIVKPKQKEHYIELSENGFSPGMSFYLLPPFEGSKYIKYV